MKLESPAFDDGGKIPEKYGYTRENVNPPLEFEDVPGDARSIVLLMDDPDAKKPAGKIWDHWTVWNIPPGTRRIDEGSLPGEAEEGVTDFGSTGYGGPNPPDREHTYRFRAYAVDRKLDLSPDTTKEDVLDAIDGHIIEEAKLEGRFPVLD